MYKFALVLTCCTWTGHGRRVQAFIGQSNSRLSAHNRTDSASGDTLAELMMAFNPSTAFSSSGKPSFPGSRPVVSGRQLRRDRHSPVMKVAALKEKPATAMFGDLIIPKSTSTALTAEGITAPLPIQDAAAMKIARGSHVLLHSETGSGKTLAYLLPILTKLHVSKPHQVIVIVPSRELALQTAAVVEQVWPYHNVSRAFVLAGTPKAAEITEKMRQRACPVVVATPRALLSVVKHLAGTEKLHSRKSMQSSGQQMKLLVKNLRTIVLDEVDALLLDKEIVTTPAYQKDWLKPTDARETKESKLKEPERFKKPASRAIQALQKARKTHVLANSLHFRKKGLEQGRKRDVNKDIVLQMVACSASATYRVRDELCRLFDIEKDQDLKVITKQEIEMSAKKLKRKHGERGIGGVSVPVMITHTWVSCMNEEEKLTAVAKVLSLNAPRCALLFMADDAPLRASVARLNELGVKAELLHEAMGFDGDVANVKAYEALRASLQDSDDSKTNAGHAAHLTESRLLVSTFGSARGLDLPKVEAVLLHSLPEHTDTYLHLAGRTGRKGGAGSVFSLLTQDEAPVIGKFTRDLGISIKQNAEIALALADARRQHSF